MEGENSWIYAFQMSISAMWNANNFFQDLNGYLNGYQFYF